MASLDERRRDMRARLRADRGDAYAKGWMDGAKEAEEVLTRRGKAGRRSAVPDEVRKQIAAWYAEGKGLSYRAIAERLNAEGIPTGQGGARWYASSVRAALHAR